MKKTLILLGIVLLSMVGVGAFSSNASAKGESFEYTSASTANGRGGSEITAYGGAFKSKTVFKKVSNSEAEKYGALYSGYSVYYIATSFNLTDDAASLVPLCKTNPALIALKKEADTKGIMRPTQLANKNGIESDCFANFMNLVDVETGDPIFSDEVTLKADSAFKARLDGYYNAMSGALKPVMMPYYGTLDSAPCGSSGCSEALWKEKVSLCWHGARSDAAASARASRDTNFNSDDATKTNFSNCLAKEINGVATAADIKNLLVDIPTATINEGGSGAWEAANEQINSEIIAATDSSVTNTTTCAIEGVGWIICPVVSFLASIADASFEFLKDNFLLVDSKITSTSENTYEAWKIMRNIANVAFVIAFLFIIFSQLTGQGIANYGIKKMLPRLVIAAILVNLSFLICQIAVDLSNILGVGIKQIFDSVGGGVISGSYNYEDQSSNWAGITVAVLAGSAIAWSLGISVLLPFLIGAVIALLMIFIILVVRQMLIILLIALAPLAFVAFLLPNTEQWFTKWRKTFTALLLVFPIIGLLFGAAGLASNILRSVYSSTGDIIGQIIAAAVIALPLFLLPSLLKGSLNAIPMIGNKLNSMSNKLSGSAKNRVGNSGLMKNFAAQKMQKRSSIATGTYAGRNPISRFRSSVNKALNNSSGFNTVTSGFGADRTLSGQAQQRKDAQEAMSMFGGDDKLVEAWASSGGNINKVPAHLALDNAQKEQFKLMSNAGHGRKPTSFLAAAQYMSESGKGNISAISSAMGYAASSGASSSEISSAWQGAQASYRKAGRGDMVGEMRAQFNANGKTPPLGIAKLTADPAQVVADKEAGWKEVDPGSVHREALATPDGLNSYNAHLNSDANNTAQALAGYDRMEARAKLAATPEILAAAQSHQRRTTGATASTITNIQEAKQYFGITR